MAAIHKRVKSFLKKKESSNFVRNGGLLMEKLISLSNGRDEINIKRFTIQEITKATNNFAEVFHCEASNLERLPDYKLYKGNLDGRPILVEIYQKLTPRDHDRVAFGTAISALMSHLNYTLKLIGCCTDYQIPAPVYEYAGTLTTLTDSLGENPALILSWGSRVKIARDVAAMVLYLHTSFPLAIVHKDLTPSNMFIDQNGIAKLFGFSCAIEIPEGESEADDYIMGTIGFLAPEYAMRGRITTKIDVYSFGVILLMLLTGKNTASWSDEVRNEICRSDEEERKETFSSDQKTIYLLEYMEQFMDDDEKLFDRNISHEVGVDEFRAIKDLALSCVQAKEDQRPEMIDVARRLHEIEKQVNKPSCRIVPPSEDNRND